VEADGRQRGLLKERFEGSVDEVLGIDGCCHIAPSTRCLLPW
jgi:hypothetical protein